MATITVTVKIRWESEEGSGGPCFICQCACWLRQRRAIILCFGEETKTDILLCESCADHEHIVDG